jgi:ribosomal protein S18 acetylase RimI-like enzyme
MLRYATIDDLDFIFNLIIEGSQEGHFDERLSTMPEAAQGLRLELSLVLREQRRVYGLAAQSFMYIHKDTPIGFAILSEIENRTDATELWMVSFLKEYRNQGHCKKMINYFLKEFKKRNKDLLARCSIKSQIMFELLIKLGFKYNQTGVQGTRALSFNF